MRSLSVPTLTSTIALGLVGLILCVAIHTGRAQSVDLRGYGRVRAEVAAQRSEFVCESADKADILFGKLLADLFWDAGNQHTTQEASLGRSSATVHVWEPYGAVIAGRNGNTVLVVGGSNVATAVSTAKREPLLVSPNAVFAPRKPYPLYLDLYDLRSVNCYTLGLSPENKYRIQDRFAFVDQFYKGGMFNSNDAFMEFTPAEGVYPLQSLIDTDFRMAEKMNMPYSVSISTGQWPQWLQNKWPQFVDRCSTLFQYPTYSQVFGPPEALGMTSDQRRASSMKYLHDNILRYRNSPSASSWDIYCGDYVYETYFANAYQGHLGYTPAGLADFHNWLKTERVLSLAGLGQRWYGDPNRFKSWDDVPLPDPDEFYGDFGPACLSIHDQWQWHSGSASDTTPPAADAPGWAPVDLAPSQMSRVLQKGASFWQCQFDATAWLAKNVGKALYLVCNIDNHGWAGTSIWLNGTSLGEIKSSANPYYGPISVPVTEQVKAGTNTLTIRVRGEAGVNAPVFLTTTKPVPYPYLGKYANARYLDCLDWRLHALNFKVADAMAYTRSLDPDRPLILDAAGANVRDFQCDLLRQYGGSMQNTGYESSYMPFNSRLGYADGFYGSCEVSGIHDIGDPAAYIPRATRRLSWTLFNTEGMYKEWRDPYYYYDIEKRAGWLTQSKRLYQLIGKMLPEKPKLGMFFSSESALLNYDGHSMWDWDLGRGELQSNHFDHVYVTDTMLRQGLGDEYPVLIDTDTLTMDTPTLDAIRRYVEKGGTFVALQNSGRNSLLEGDSWPISRLTGFRVVGVGKTGKIKFGNDLPILKGWAGKEFTGAGTALDWQSNDSAKGVSIAMSPEQSDTVSLAKWDDGTVAVGMRRLGKGRIVVLGSNFWRYGSDVGGTGQLKAGELEGRFLNDFLPDLGVTRNANASSGILYARKTVTKNGLQNWLVAINTASTETVGDVGMTMDRAPTSVWDSLTGSPVEFTYSDGWVWIKNVKFPPYGTRIFGCQRASLSSGLDVWWLEKTKFWTRRVAVKPDSGAVPTEAAPSSTRVFDSWRFLADKDGSVGAGAAWNLPGYDDRSWRSADNTPWNLQFDDLKDYAGVALYRSAPFDLPASWRGKTITVNLDGQLRYCWTSFELSINGQPVPQLIRSRLKVDVTSLLKNTGNVLCIKMTGKSVDGDFPLSGLAGTGVWLEREVTLQPMMSLLGPWQAVHPGWTTSSPVEIVGAPQSLTDDGRIKPGVAAVVSNHFVRDVEIPESWRGRNVYVHIVTPQMSNNTPPVGGLGRGMLLVNGEAKLIDQRPNVAVNEMINVTAMLKFGASNRLELWGQNAGPFTEGGTVINDLAIGCEAM